MPKKSKLKCYFGCAVDGPLHHFPKWDYLNSEKFESWKAVLDETTQEKGNNYIYNSVRICYRHFEECYRLPSSQLTRNAIPSLHLYNTQKQQEPQIIQEQSLQSFSLQDLNLNPPPSTSHELQPGKHDNTQHEPQHKLTQERPTITLDVKNTKNRPTRFKQEEQLRQKLIALRLKCKTQQSRIKAAVKLAKTKSFIEKIEKLPEPIKIFTQLQLKHKKKRRGRKYSLSEKILCLTIYKHSRKAYTWMENLGFVLPSKRTLQKLTSKVVIHPGINYDVMNHLKATVLKMEPEEKYCILLYDEMSLAPGLQYQKFSGEIIGFEDYGYTKTDKIADHVLVLMIKGLKSKYKQPISYTFCQGATKKEHLKKILIDAIKTINSTGLTVVATVCDQSQTNMSVIKSLFEDTKAEYLRREDELKSLSYEIDGKKIFHLYDPPHLLKGMRNNLLGKDLRYIENGEKKIAKWEHIVMLFETDVGDDEIRLCNRLTEAHVLKEKIPKMKVKNAAQVFSQRVSSAMRFCARHKILPQECIHTADFLLKMDQLFDSFNGHSYQPDKKKFKGPLKRNSKHFVLWKDLLPIFQSMGFKTIKKNGTVAYEKVPSITNFIHNIKTYQEIFEYLNREKGITSLTTRTINQDPLENFFCQIRSHGVRDINRHASILLVYIKLYWLIILLRHIL